RRNRARVDRLNAERLDHLGGLVNAPSPPGDISLHGIVHPTRMLSMPVHTMRERHVVTNKDDLRRLHLNGEIQSMEAGIPTPSDSADCDKLKLVLANEADQVDISPPRSGLLIDGEFQRVLCLLMVPRPPVVIACVTNVCPRQEQHRIVDGDYSRSSSDFFERRVPDGRSSCDDDDGFASPVREPGWRT